MIDRILKLIRKVTGAQAIVRIEVVQRLWRGYGEIVRYGLIGSDRSSVIVKQVQLPGQGRRPRKRDSGLSHRRKIRSYQVEAAWYGRWSKFCDVDCRVPDCLAFESSGDNMLIVLEDLDAGGFPARRSVASQNDMDACLQWLANFHATFIGERPEGLWPIGTYWHLATRPDELNALEDIALKHAAEAIDLKLSASPYQTFVHGDAKLANFCFSQDGGRVAAVDFQYVGGGPGIKDVAYFIDSCLDGDDCERQESRLLDVYFQALKQALASKRRKVDSEALERDWRSLYPVAWTDFHRFLKGWSPGRWDSNSYSERLAREVVAQLQDIQRKDDALVRG